MNNSISNNIRNTEFRGNQAQQGSAIFLNNSQPVRPHNMSSILSDSPPAWRTGPVQGCKVACSQACTTEAQPRRRGLQALLGSRIKPSCVTLPGTRILACMIMSYIRNLSSSTQTSLYY